MKYKDYYAILGVAREASDEDIKRAYRKLARKYHPDVSKEADAEEKFKEVSEAYETLRDPEKRTASEQLGRHRAGQEFRPPPGWAEQFGVGGEDGADLGDIFEHIFGAGRFGQGGRSGHGRDYEARVHLTLEQAARGTDIALALPGGQATARVRVPKGVTDGDRMRVPGKGMPGARGGKPGDLYLDIAIQPHRLYRVSGHDLYLDVPLAPWEVVLGGAVDVPTLDGRIAVSVPAGARAGQKLRVSGRGLPRPRGGAGDLYCVLSIVTPAHPGEQEKKLYADLARASSFNPRAHFE
ncbi:MAG: DnaJ domain-containing protein [Burkholderiales bacterium]|nr:DnaJ domain-containing protein [Burkholderiales bacterium]